MPYQVRANELNEDSPLIHVEGTLMYSTLMHRIAGEELDKINADLMARNRYTKSGPYITATLANAHILPISGDENTITREEFYIKERFYDSKKPKEGETGKRMTQDSPVPDTGFMPPIYKRVSNEANADGHYEYEQIVGAPGEVAAGAPVRLVLRVYKPRNQVNRGISIHSVFVETDEVEFLDPSNPINPRDRKALQDRGIVIVGDTVRIGANEGNTPALKEDNSSNDTAGNTQQSIPADQDGLPPVMAANQQPQTQTQSQQSAPAPQQQQETQQTQAPQQFYDPNAAQNQAPAQAPAQNNNENIEKPQPAEKPQENNTQPAEDNTIVNDPKGGFFDPTQANTQSGISFTDDE